MGRHFVANLVVLVGIPLVGYIGAQLPELRGVLFGWLGAALGTFAR